MSHQKVLIVYEETGGGHEMMANILVTILAKEPKVTIIIKTVSELVNDPVGDRLAKLWVSGWNTLIRHNLIKLADALINYLMRFTLLPIGEVSIAEPVHEALDLIEPDILICTADVLGKCLGTWAKERQIPYFIVITELSVFLDLVHPYATHICYFPETVNAIRSFPLTLTYWSQDLTRSSSPRDKLRFISNYLYEFVVCYRQNRIYCDIDRHYPAQNSVRCEVIGLLREAQHFQSVERSQLRQQLNIAPDRPCVLIISGSLGGNFCTRYLQTLQNLNLGSLTLIVACGRDKKLFETVNKIVDRTKNIEIRGLDFVDNLHQWISAADLILARPSAGVLLEALLARTPLLFPRQATANDRGAIALVEKYQLGECFECRQELLLKLTRLLDKTSYYQNKIDTFLSVYPNTFEAQSRRILQVILSSKQENS
ncbi:MAG: glycosyltransferase [Cyanobacteria bacterium P01_A01_bin.40]